MRFSEHFEDIQNLINEEKSVETLATTFYGSEDHISDYINDTGDNTVMFWSLDEGVEDHHVKLLNVLYIEHSEYDADDLYFNTKCVGYAIENGYDNVIVETSVGSYAISIHLDSASLLTEAPEQKLKGKKLTPKQRAVAIDKRKTKIQPKGTTRRPGKSPKQGISVDVLLANTGKLSPDRVERGMRQVRKQPPKLTGVKDVGDEKYFRAEYNFTSLGSSKRQMGYADISQDKKYCNELFCSCSDFFYRLYAPYVKAGLSTWNVPAKFKSKQSTNVVKAPHNHHWTTKTNEAGKLFLCKHLWAFLAYYVAGNAELSDEEIEEIIGGYFDDVEDDDTDIDLDTDDSDEAETEFQKAFGKLYVGQKGKDIEHVANKDDVKKGDRKQTFYKLPGNKKEVDDEKEE